MMWVECTYPGGVCTWFYQAIHTICMQENAKICLDLLIFRIEPLWGCSLVCIYLSVRVYIHICFVCLTGQFICIYVLILLLTNIFV